MTYQKGGETFFTRKMKKAKGGQTIRLNEVKIFNLGSGNAKKNNKKTFQQIFQGRTKSNLNEDTRKQWIGDCSIILRFRKKTKTGNFECEMPKKYKEYFEGGLFSKHRNCYKFILHGLSIKTIKNPINNNLKSNILGKINNKIGKNIYIVTFSKPGMSIGYFIIDNYLLYFTTNNKQDIQLNKELMPIIEKSNKIAKQVSIYFIRHAWSCSNLFGYFGTLTRLKMPELTPDAQLSGLGTVQAQLLGYNPYMKTIFQNAKFIGSSVLTRATQTALYAKLYSGFTDETLHIIPAINETLWQPKGMKLSNELRTFISRTATPIDYIHGKEELKKKLENIGLDLGGQKVDLDLYYNFYKELIGNHNQLKKHRNKMAIESTHDIFMKLVLPHLVEKKGLKNNEFGVVFGHGRYIKEIAAHCYKLTGKKYYQDIVNEGIYNTGIYKVNYVKYEGEDDWELYINKETEHQFTVNENNENAELQPVEHIRPFQKIFPILDTKNSRNLREELYNKRSEAYTKEGLNKKRLGNIINKNNYQLISNEANIKNTRLNTLISKINNKEKDINLTNYRNLLSKTLKPDTLFDKMYLNKAIMKQKSSKKGISLLYYYPKEGSGLPKIPIMLTGQKTGEDKGLLRETWKKYPNLYIGDSEGYRVNKGIYSSNNRNRMMNSGVSKFNHGCLIDLKKFILKEKLTDEDIKKLQDNINETIKKKISNNYSKYKKTIKNTPLKKLNYNYWIRTKKKKSGIGKLNIIHENNENYNNENYNENYIDNIKLNRNKIMKNFKKTFSVEKKIKGINYNFAKLLYSNNLTETYNKFINQRQYSEIMNYISSLENIIKILNKNGDVDILNGYINEFITNIFFNSFYIHLTKNQYIKEILQKNFQILINLKFLNNKNISKEGVMISQTKADINRWKVKIFKSNKQINRKENGLTIIDFFKLLTNKNISTIMKVNVPDTFKIRKINELTNISMKDLIDISHFLNQQIYGTPTIAIYHFGHSFVKPLFLSTNQKQESINIELYFSDNNKLLKIRHSIIYEINIYKVSPEEKKAIELGFNYEYDAINNTITANFENKKSFLNIINRKNELLGENIKNTNIPRNPNMNQQPPRKNKRNNRKNYNVGEFVNIKYKGEKITAEIIRKNTNGTYIVSLGGGSKGINKGVRIKANDIIGKQEPLLLV